MEPAKINGAVIGRLHSDTTRPIHLGSIEEDHDSECTMLLEEFATAELALEHALEKRGFSELAATSRELAKTALSMRPNGQDRQAEAR